MQLVATATLAAVAGGGGLGRIITAGFNLQHTTRWWRGALLVAVLALLVEAVFVLLQRYADPLRRSSRRTGPSAVSGPFKNWVTE